MSQSSTTKEMECGYRIATEWTHSGEAEAHDGYDASCYFRAPVLETAYPDAASALEAAQAAYRGEDEFGVGLRWVAVPALADRLAESVALLS